MLIDTGSNRTILKSTLIDLNDHSYEKLKQSKTHLNKKW